MKRPRLDTARVFVGHGSDDPPHPMFATPLESDERFEVCFPLEDGTVGHDYWFADAEHARCTIGWQVRRVRIVEGRVVGGYEDDRRAACPQGDLFEAAA